MLNKAHEASGSEIPAAWKGRSGRGKVESDAVRSIAADESMQLSLLSCAAEIVNFVFEPNLSFPELTYQLGRLGEVLSLWQAVGTFWTHLPAAGRQCASPESIIDLLTFMR